MGTKAAAKKKSNKTDKSGVVDGPIKAQDHIRIDMLIDEKDESGNLKNTSGWVHTHGMWEKFGLHDLEIRGVRPSFMMVSAGQLLNHVAQYMIDGKLGIRGAKQVKAGEVMGLGFINLRFLESAPLNPEDDEECETHFSTPRFLLVNAQEPVCAECKEGTPHGPH